MRRVLPERNVNPEASKPLNSQYNQYLPSWNSGENGTDFQEGEYDGITKGAVNKKADHRTSPNQATPLHPPPSPSEKYFVNGRNH